MRRRQQHNGRHWAPPDRIPDGDQVLHPGDRRSADILRSVLEGPTKALPVLRPLMTPGQEARSSRAARQLASGADIAHALDLPSALPPWSALCWIGEHAQCDGTAAPADGCYCPCHRGEPVA